MPRPVRPWFRFYTEAFNDRKILRLSPVQRWIWVAILGAARESPTPGELLIADDEPMTVDELARYAGVRVKDVSSALPIMERLGMIDRKERSITVPNFTHRQYESDNVTTRTRAYRERSKEQRRNVPGNTPETETETEEKTSSSEIANATSDKEPMREDVNHLCSLLQTRIVENGSKRPNITQAWRREARLLLDRDHVPMWEAIAAIEWCQADSFWKTNILSMPKFREKFDQMRLRAQEQRTRTRRLEPVVEYRDEPAPDPESLPWLQEEGA